MRIAYAKLGRSVLLDPGKWGVVGGDNEPLELLLRLAARRPQDTFVIAGRHSGDPGNLPPNVEVPTLPKELSDDEVRGFISQLYYGVDHAVLHIGQHGTSNMPIPQDKDPSKLTNPQEWSLRYAGPIMKGVNDLTDDTDGEWEPIWLVQDPRNYLKARDLKWYPTQPILGQYEFTRKQSHYRFGDDAPPGRYGRQAFSIQRDPLSWTSEHSYMYSGLELAGVPRWEDKSWTSFGEREHFGMLVNENREYVKHARLGIMRDWVMPLKPAYICGKWRPEAQAELGIAIRSVPYDHVPDMLSSVKTTLTTPASGSEWATAKPWECFAVNTVCFFHPRYDAQGHIVPTLAQVPNIDDTELQYLVWWLRPQTPEELALRVAAVHQDENTYNWIVAQQRKLLDEARERNLIMELIDARLDGLPCLA